MQLSSSGDSNVSVVRDDMLASPPPSPPTGAGGGGISGCRALSSSLTSLSHGTGSTSTTVLLLHSDCRLSGTGAGGSSKLLVFSDSIPVINTSR